MYTAETLCVFQSCNQLSFFFSPSLCDLFEAGVHLNFFPTYLATR